MEPVKAKIKSLAKGMALLDELTGAALTGDGMGLSQLAQSLSAPKNTTHNLLQTLVACGYARQDDSALYYLGPKAWQMGTLQQALNGNLASLVKPVLNAFVHEHHEAAVFVVLAAGRRVVLLIVDADQAVTVNSAQVQQNSTYAMPTGRVLLAQVDEITRRQFIEREGWPGQQWDGIESMSQLDEACDAINAAGYSGIDSPDSGLVALAVPVVDATGRLLGSVGCYAPSFRCDSNKEKAMLDGLRRSAEMITAAGKTKPA
ncbi:MAG TPA: IclR family transcriptional regulator [Phycisphaerae bacterium]|nr:IclR family transcriptional regulator [Phycisphaerae bacterium]